MTELGVGYLSILADTSRIPGQITSALGGAQSSANRAGESMGSRLASGIGKTLKVGVVAAGVAAGGLLASSLHKGIGRLTAIDDAQGKLTALGNSTASTAKIMDSALAAVKGTSYGLGDAATIAASAVAAGVKPGQDLTRYLGLTADAASIAGTSLSEMGQIINKVQTSGTAYTMEITQLADRGLPIWQWLATEMKKPQAEMKKLVAEGKVDSATYLRAIENNIGGAATAATTVSSAWANLGAAQGRFGATIAGPIFRQAIPAFLGLTKAVDELDTKAKPIMATFEKNLTGKYIPAILDFGNQGKEAFEKFRDSDFAVQSMSKIGDIVEQVVETGREVAPAIGSIVTSLSKASAALGVSTWQIFLTTLEASATILDATLVPILNATAGLMENNTVAVAGLLGAFMLFKTVPGIMARIAPSMATLTAQTAAGRVPLTNYQRLWMNTGNTITGTRTHMRNFGAEVRNTQAWAGAAGRPIGVMSAGMLTLGQNAQSAGAALGGKLKAGISNLTGALGGGVGIGIMAAAIAIPQLVSSAKNWDVQAQITEKYSDDVAESQRKMARAFSESKGAVDDNVMGQLQAQSEAYMTSLKETADEAPDMWDHIVGMGKNLMDNKGMFDSEGAGLRDLADRKTAALRARETIDSLKAMGVGADELSAALAGTNGQWGSFYKAASANEDVSWQTLQSWSELRAETQNLQTVSASVSPVLYGLSDAFKVLTDDTASASAKASAFHDTMNLIAGIPPSLGDATQSFNKTVRETKKLFEEKLTPEGGSLGGDLIDKVTGGVNTMTENGTRIRSAIQEIRTSGEALVTAGGDVDAALAGMHDSFKQVTEAAGLLPEQMEKILRAEGFSEDWFRTAAAVQGMNNVDAALTTLKLTKDSLNPGEPLRLPVELANDEHVRKALEKLNLDLKELNGGSHFEVVAKTEGALNNLDAAAAKALELSEFRATLNIDAKTDSFDIKAEQTEGMVNFISGLELKPGADIDMTQFEGKRQLTVEQLSELSTKTANPQAILDGLRKFLTDSAEAKRALDALQNKSVTVSFNAIYSTAQQHGAFSSEAAAEMLRQQRGYAIGGRIPAFAGGGKLPTTGPGTDTVDGILGVDSNGIPTARVNRGEWVINDRSSERYHRELASINAGTFPKLPGYETGGVVGSRDLTDFVMGRIPGVKPLTGDPYNFGGINWGDCSAAMSAIARFAVGLAPFAARFATASMGAALAGMGFQSGRGGAGDLRFGWYNGGPGGGHTAGTLPDGTNVEMGGSYGGGMVGGSVGSNHPSMTDHAYLPIAASPVRGEVARIEWTDKEQLDLEAAEIAVRKAEEARVEVENAMAEGKKTQTDLDDANNKVAKAQEKVTSLQAKKDGIVEGTYKAPPPQAPALSRMFTDAEADRIDAQLAVQSANERRNEVYDDPESTDTDISKADAELFKAEKALRELGMTKDGNSPTSWSEIAGDFAKNAASGFVSDALGVFGIPDEIPPAVQAMRMFEEAQQTQAPYLIEPSADQRAMGAQVTTSPSMIAQDSPAIYNPAEGVARWGDSVAKGQDGVAALLEEIERIRSGNRFAKGGPVDGPGGTDNVPAWLTKREFVVNALDANAGQNPTILQAMNNGARLSLGQGGQSGSTYIFNGVANVEEGLRQLRVKELQEAATHGWGIR
ncbi:tape measure protein [Rhodococcus sp. BH5]|uniref:tape measure protein n=1 Tax=Rhodococcus sp. BH5 TaxID=2871702 RepID=UPI0022CD918E|nr:tape measure protein [Rhodococcus sp. BH5]MCZ9635161.1 tape measure protein [Rhodococcus sp. BH5]